MLMYLISIDKRLLVFLTVIICGCADILAEIIQDQSFDAEQAFTAQRRLASDRPCVRWGNTFDVPLNSKNLLRPCKLPDGRPVCCSALMNYTKTDAFAKPVGWNFHPPTMSSLGGGLNDKREMTEDGSGRVGKDDKCSISKRYVSSPQELRDLEVAKRISAISDDHKDPKRFDALINYVFSDEIINNSTRWLNRVHEHMTSETLDDQQHHQDDWEFLSRFEFTRICGSVVDKWIEWIEPITIPARHPFGFGRCRPVKPSLKPGTPNTGRSDVDYVLLQSGKGLFDQTYHRNGRRVLYDEPNSGPSSTTNVKRHRYTPIKHFMLDSGTSTFDSSLFWFTCAYSQRKVGFDQVFAWEMTLLEPNDYWRRVPPQWKPFWHFYNVPIHSDLGHADSPLRFLQQIATPADFVAFKLDIDHPDMEMPIALSLLADPSLAALIDEFFFELHFRCEVMTSCGWGKRVPAESHGLVLDRPQILQFFIDLRKQGIRAHIWP